MIEYLIEHNPDDRLLARAVHILRSGGLVSFPTETNWVAVADPFQQRSVDRLYRLRHIENTKHLTFLCCDFKSAMEIAHIDDGAFSLLRRVVPGPYTFIFEAQKKVTKYLKASKVDHQVGIRFPPKPLGLKLIDAFGGALISSHISHSMVDGADPEIPLYGALLDDQLANFIDLFLDPGDYEFIGPTTIVDFTSGEPVVQRVGSGNPSLFQ